MKKSSLITYDMRDVYYHTDIDDQLRCFVHKLSMKAIERAEAELASIKSVDEAESRKKRIREALISAIGGLPEDSPLDPKVTGIIQCNGFNIEKVIFQSRAKEYVTSNLYVPQGLSAPAGAVLFVCGHHRDAKQNMEYQRVCQYLVRAGLVVLAMDPIGQGERFSYYDRNAGKNTVPNGSYEHDYIGAQCFLTGRGLASYFLHDCIRAVDYLCTRPEVDSTRIGVTGNSGGGTQTALMMMGDPRIAAAAPGTFITSRRRYLPVGEAQCLEQVWPGFTSEGMGYADMLAVMAPKPVLVLASKNDYFPIEGTRETVAEARRIWELYGLAENLELFEEDVSHQYSRNMAVKAAEFFSLHLNNRRVNVENVKIELLEPSRLDCTVSGQVLGDFADARTVYDNNCDIADTLKNNRLKKTGQDRLEAVKGWLENKVFSGRIPYPPNVRCIHEEESKGLSFKFLLWWTQEDLFNYGVLIRDAALKDKQLPLTIAVWDKGTLNIDENRKWILETCKAGRNVLVLDVSGSGVLAPNYSHESYERYKSGFIISLCLLWLNDSLPALRTYDVIRAVDAMSDYSGIDSNDIRLYGRGRYGLYAGLAAMLDRRVKGFGWDESMNSFEALVKTRHYDFKEIMAIVMPGILEYFDLPDWREH